MIKKFKNMVLLKNNIFIAIGIFTIALFFVVVTPQRVYADSTTTDGFTYSVDGSHATITSYQWKGGLPDITIPTTITSDGNTYKVTQIANYAFDNNYYNNLVNLTSIVIPSSVTSIGNGAFYNCSGLKKLTIPESVTSIGDSAFYNCSNLTNVIIPNSVTSIGNDEFSGCSKLTNVTIPDNVTSIGNNSFSSCESFTSITIPNSVTSIGSGAFARCTNLTAMTIPSSVTFIDSNAFSECTLLSEVNFLGNAPSTGDDPLFSDCSPSFKIYYLSGNTGFTNPWEWCSTEATINNSTATFNSQGGSTVINELPTSNNTIIAPASPTKTGYTFGGWYKEVGCLNAWNFITDTVTSDTTLYAKWIIVTPGVTYQTQIQSIGWQEWVSNGHYSGTIGQSKRLEAIKIKLNGPLPAGASIQYEVQGQTYGWNQGWKSDGQEAGTDHQAKRLEAIKIKLVNMPGYSIRYRVQVQSYGWQGWVKDGATAGTVGQSKRLETIDVQIVPTGSTAEPSITDITAGEVITLSKRLPSYSDLVANGDTFDAPTIYDGAWFIYVGRPNGLAEGSIMVDKNRAVSFMFPDGELYEVTPY